MLWSQKRPVKTTIAGPLRQGKKAKSTSHHSIPTNLDKQLWSKEGDDPQIQTKTREKSLVTSEPSPKDALAKDLHPSAPTSQEHEDTPPSAPTSQEGIALTPINLLSVKATSTLETTVKLAPSSPSSVDTIAHSLDTRVPRLSSGTPMVTPPLIVMLKKASEGQTSSSLGALSPNIAYWPKWPVITSAQGKESLEVIMHRHVDLGRSLHSFEKTRDEAVKRKKNNDAISERTHLETDLTALRKVKKEANKAIFELNYQPQVVDVKAKNATWKAQELEANIRGKINQALLQFKASENLKTYVAEAPEMKSFRHKKPTHVSTP
ncbi:hypothetical protein NE237_010521 [Protea cynaroides]|uniref:Uncharacterized protein n=1 Tax=Protea cynaroides TaxID=273540 RepID=A0A9Q0L0E6_9MAGN|nr:hypothetical protein NE237_010521 [Protea cynaroides]